MAAGLIIISIIGIACSMFLFSGSGRQSAVITVDGKPVKTVLLREGYREEFRLGGQEHYNIIEVDGRRIRIREADCPDQICVQTGWIETAPRQIVCLPWRVVITIVAENHPSDIDDIAR